MSLPKKLNTNFRYQSSGARNCSVSIIQPNAGLDSTGNPLPPVTLIETWANISIYRGRELDKQQERVGYQSYRVVIPYPKTYTIDSGCQIQHGSQLHNIETIFDPDGRRVELHMYTWVSNESVAGVTV